jgi:hypothetical protein
MNHSAKTEMIKVSSITKVKVTPRVSVVTLSPITKVKVTPRVSVVTLSPPITKVKVTRR